MFTSVAQVFTTVESFDTLYCALDDNGKKVLLTLLLKNIQPMDRTELNFLEQNILLDDQEYNYYASTTGTGLERLRVYAQYLGRTRGSPELISLALYRLVIRTAIAHYSGGPLTSTGASQVPLPTTICSS